MKTEFLKNLEIDDEVIEKIMKEHGKSIEKQKKHVTDITGERDTLQTQLDEISEKLKSFDGIDIEALKGEIDTLKGDIAKKEDEFKTQLADRDFSASVSTAIAAAKGKNAKAIMAMLDIDTLKGSKNQKEDVGAALAKLQESDAYLFEPAEKDEPPTTPARVSTGGSHDADGDGKSASSTTNSQMNDLLRGKTKGD